MLAYNRGRNELEKRKEIRRGGRWRRGIYLYGRYDRILNFECIVIISMHV